MSSNGLPPPHAFPTPGESPALMWRALGALFFAGGTIGVISLLLAHPASFDDDGLWTNIALAYAVSAVCLVGARRLPRSVVHAMLVGGTLAITRAVYLSGDPGGFYAFFYVWVGLYAFFFFGRGPGIAHTAVVGIAYAWVLAELGDATPVAHWMTTVGTLAVGGVLIDILAGRLRHLASRFATIAAERAALLTKLEHVARTDDLTGLPNRRAWDEELAREMARARRDETPLCVAVIDLDRFKDYNDDHGHQAGDRMLKSVAAAWRLCLRATDVLARYGGEEFALALPGCDVGDATDLVERLREAIAEDQACSAGLSEWDRSESPASLLGRADVALYAAKAAGRGRVTVAP